MKCIASILPRLSAAAAVLALSLGSGARADVAYAYAQQRVSNIIVSGTGLAAATPTGSSTSAAAAINGTGVATNNVTDTLQAYQGTGPAAAQNFFSKYSTSGGGTQAGDFTRGDALLGTPAGLFTTGTSANSVAESFISTGSAGSSGPGLLTASGSFSLSGTFTAPTTTTINIAFNFANDILTLLTPVGTTGNAQASFKFTVSIKDQRGNEVNVAPVVLNTALSSPPNGPGITNSGSGVATISLATLNAGDTFSIALSGTTLSSVSLTAVPEPGTLTLMSGLALVGGLGAWVRRARSKVA